LYVQSITHKAKEGLKDEARLEEICEFESAVDGIVAEMVGAAKEEAHVKAEAQSEARIEEGMSSPIAAGASPLDRDSEADSDDEDKEQGSAPGRLSRGSHAEVVVKSEPMDTCE
jgi:hypothetical protein